MDRNESAPAIVVRSARQGERDRMLTLLSPVWGLRRTLVYGAQKSRKAVKASLYTEAVFHVYNNRERGLVSLVDLDVIATHEAVLSSLEASFAASLMAEIVIAEKGEGPLGWYRLLTDCLDALEGCDYRAVASQFILRALALAGHGSDFRTCPVCGAAYGESEIVGFSGQILAPCCQKCDSEGMSLILPPNARRYLADSLDVPLPRALSFRISPLMLTRILGYLVRLYSAESGALLRSADSLIGLAEGSL